MKNAGNEQISNTEMVSISRAEYERFQAQGVLEILLAALSVILVRRLLKNAMSIASMPELMNPSMPDSRP